MARLLILISLTIIILFVSLTTTSSIDNYGNFNKHVLQKTWAAENNYDNEYTESSIGIIEWTRETYSIEDKGIIRVTDDDSRFNPEEKDHLQIAVFSDSDLAGILLNLTETDKNSKVFEGPISFTIKDESSAKDGLLRVTDEDIVTAEYKDQTLPKVYWQDELDITDTTTIISREKTTPSNVTLKLDQLSYSWTDKVFITVIAPSFNMDSESVDEIGNDPQFPINISTRGYKIEQYKLVETGIDTGIFTGEVTLTGFPHNADGDMTTGNERGIDIISDMPRGTGPSDGMLPSSDNDGVTVTFQINDTEVVISSASIKWNIGEIQWDKTRYFVSDTGVVRVIDPDMNLDPESKDSFDIDVWSDVDVAGINLDVIETGDSTGVFEGSIFFSVSEESFDNQLRVTEIDFLTAEYEDNTLPYPYATTDELHVTTTAFLAGMIPPIEKISNSKSQTINIFDNCIDTSLIDQQIQIVSELSNNQNRRQSFAYLVQIQDENGITVSLAWITGILERGQTFNPVLSWIPTKIGVFDVTTYVWESVDNPTALSPPITTSISITTNKDQTSDKQCVKMKVSDLNNIPRISSNLPPMERSPASNCRLADAFGNSLNTFYVDQQVQITCDITNNQENGQPFTYFVQIQNKYNEPISLQWISGYLEWGQVLSPALSWIPTDSGEYIITIFVWESIERPVMLSPPISLEIDIFN